MKTKKPNDQKQFLHGNKMALEFLARGIRGEGHFGSVNYTDIVYWKKTYLAGFELVRQSIFRSIGSVDEKHRTDLTKSIDRTIQEMSDERDKDRIHAVLIVGLFQLVFLLLGRPLYYQRGKARDFSTFRTLSYSQTEEQLSWILQGHIQKNSEQLGFSDSFEADQAYSQWTKERKLKYADRSNYVEWVRKKLPSVLLQFK